MNEEPKLFDVLDKHTDEHDDSLSFGELKSTWEQYLVHAGNGPKQAGDKVIANRYVMVGLLTMSPYLCGKLLEAEEWQKLDEIVAHAQQRLTQLSAANPSVNKMLIALQKGTIEVGEEDMLFTPEQFRD